MWFEGEEPVFGCSHTFLKSVLRAILCACAYSYGPCDIFLKRFSVGSTFTAKTVDGCSVRRVCVCFCLKRPRFFSNPTRLRIPNGRRADTYRITVACTCEDGELYRLWYRPLIEQGSAAGTIECYSNCIILHALLGARLQNSQTPRLCPVKIKILYFSFESQIS